MQTLGSFELTCTNGKLFVTPRVTDTVGNLQTFIIAKHHPKFGWHGKWSNVKYMNVKGIYHLLSKKMEVSIATKPEIKVYSFPPSLETSSVFYPDEKVTH